MTIRGQIYKFGDDVNTDDIIPARFLNTSDPEELAGHCMEGIDPAFTKRAKAGGIIVAGKNFGCGSSREHAPLSIKTFGISAVVATSFARIFYRNSLNIGLPIIECPDIAAKISERDEMEIDFEKGIIKDLTTDKTYPAKPWPEFMQRLIEVGGLMNYVRGKL
ncbi:MAG: 3-isopropylmalate dehydratase small subunit [bacterium]|nr:3-isopropylmalate dehydratase small subunit [bacterium]